MSVLDELTEDKLRAIVESAYREGFRNGLYPRKNTYAPLSADEAWDRSEAKRALQ